MHTEKTLFELQSKVESVEVVAQTLKYLKANADSSLGAFNTHPARVHRVVVNDFTFHPVPGSVCFEQWVETHLKPALQHLCEMSVSEAYGVQRTLHHLTRPENDASPIEPIVLPGVDPGMR